MTWSPMDSEAWYACRGLGALFDGLQVRVGRGDLLSDETTTVREVVAVRSGTNLMGPFNMAVPRGSLFVRADQLTRVAEEQIELASDNPFGKFLSEQTYMRDNRKLHILHYQNALTISLKEDDVTVYGRSYFDMNVAVRVEEKLLNGWADGDWEYLIMELELMGRDSADV